MKKTLSIFVTLFFIVTSFLVLASFKSGDKVECGGVNSTTYYDGDWDVYVIFTNINDFTVDVEYEINGKRYGSTSKTQTLADGTCSIPAHGQYKVYLPSYTTRGYTSVYKTAYRYR